MNAFFRLTKNQILALSQDELADAIKVEAIERGIKIPISLSEAIQRSGFSGYIASPQDQAFYQIDGKHGEVAWLSQEAATQAMAGSVVLQNTYNKGILGMKLSDDLPTIKRITIPGPAKTYKVEPLEEYLSEEDREGFDKLTDEITEAYSVLRREKYNEELAKERQVEYLRLAGGDAEVAKRFWLKSETLEWPA